MAVAGLAAGDAGHVGTPMFHHGRGEFASQVQPWELKIHPGKESDGRKPTKCGASQHGWGLHPAAALGDAPEDALSFCPSAHTRPPLWATSSGADRVGDTGQHGSALLPGSTHGCPQKEKRNCPVPKGCTGTRARPWVLPKGPRAAEARYGQQCRQRCPHRRVRLVQYHHGRTRLARPRHGLGAAGSTQRKPPCIPFPVDGARQEPGTNGGFFHPPRKNGYIFEVRCNLVDFDDRQKSPA